MEISNNKNSNEFNMAADYAKKIIGKRTNDELKELYGLFKQATIGDVNISKPGLLDFKGRDKWNAWNQKKGLSKHTSEVNYITLINNLIKKYGINE
jgi:diazepam-binding inhibitor (GABA receptor modulator, acyl-CoA-binding protein)